MKSRGLIIVVFFLMCGFNLFASQQTFIKTINLDTLSITPTGTCKSTNGDYFNYGIAGMYKRLLYIMKFNAQHDTLWTVLIDSLSENSQMNIVTGTNDGGCAIRDNYVDLVILRLGPSGNLVYSRTYGPITLQGVGDIIQTRDSGLLVMFMDEHIGNPSYYFGQLIKLNRYGDTLWTRIDMPVSYDAWPRLFENDLGEIYLMSAGSIMKIDSEGFSKWYSYLPSPDHAGFNLCGFAGYHNEKLAVWDRKQNAYAGDSATLYLLDSSGICFNAVRFSGQEIVDATFTYGGNLALVLQSYHTDSLSILGLDANLHGRFCKKYFRAPGIIGTSRIIQLDDSSLFVCGSRPDTISNSSLGYLMLTGESGELGCAGDTDQITLTSVVDSFQVVQYVTGGDRESPLNFFSFNNSFSASHGVSITPVCVSVGTEEVLQSGWTVFPNPATTNIHISSESEMHSIVVTSVLGKVLLEKKLNGENDFDLKLEELVSGYYFVIVIDEDGSRREKSIIVQH